MKYGYDELEGGRARMDFEMGRIEVSWAAAIWENKVGRVWVGKVR
jgi:hypothetical protein